MDEEPDRPETRIAPATIRRRADPRVRTTPVLGQPGLVPPGVIAPSDVVLRHQRLWRQAGALISFVAAIAAVVGAVVLFSGGFAGPAPIALVAAGGFIAVGASLWGTTRRAAGITAPPRGNRPDAARREDPLREHHRD